MAKSQKKIIKNLHASFKETFPEFEGINLQELQPNQVEWKVQTDKNGTAQVVCYIDARYVHLLNFDLFGGMHSTEVRHVLKSETTRSWKQTEEKWMNGRKQQVEVDVTEKTYNYGVVQRVSYKVGDQIIFHEDGAEETDIEGFKGGISDAAKRVAGRYSASVMNLYKYPKVFIKHGGDKVEIWKYENQLAQIVLDANAGTAREKVWLDKTDEQVGARPWGEKKTTAKREETTNVSTATEDQESDKPGLPIVEVEITLDGNTKKKSAFDAVSYCKDFALINAAKQMVVNAKAVYVDETNNLAFLVCEKDSYLVPWANPKENEKYWVKTVAEKRDKYPDGIKFGFTLKKTK